MAVTFEINRAKRAFDIGSWTTLLDLLGEHCATAVMELAALAMLLSG